MLNDKTLQFISDHEADDVYSLAFKPVPEGVDLQRALQQIAALKIVKTKVPSWAENKALLYPKHLSLEQCSSEITARFKADLMAAFVGKTDFTLADLTGGMGVDCYFMSQHTSAEVHYVEQDAELCNTAAHNFSLLNKSITVHNTSAEKFVAANSGHRFDVIYLDPARRGSKGEKLVSIADCKPNVCAMQQELFALTDRIVVKLSPMLDIQRSIREISNIQTLYVISVANECKELLLLINSNYTAEPEIRAVNLDSAGGEYETLCGIMSSENSLTANCSAPLSYLYEPYAAHLKSGLFKTMCERYGVCKLHINSHLYTSAELKQTFPGRCFKIIETVDFDKHSAKKLFSSLSCANITARNFPLPPEKLRIAYKVKDGGKVYIFATTTIQNRKILVVCEKI